LGQFSKHSKIVDSLDMNLEIYRLMMKNGVVTFSIISFVFILSTFLFLFSDVWLGIFATNIHKLQDEEERLRHLIIYAAVAFSAGFFVIIRDIVYRGR
jgi:hypothetical protein